MMGPRQVDQAALFYEFSLERHVPAAHLLRALYGWKNDKAVGDTDGDGKLNGAWHIATPWFADLELETPMRGRRGFRIAAARCPVINLLP
jgi:hypothetical protein